MSDFQESYISLLKEQVQQEIHYLIRHGHDTDKIDNPCIFCSPRHGYHVCYRLNELRRFQSQIVQHEATRSRETRNVPKQRREIGNPRNPTLLTSQEINKIAIQDLDKLNQSQKWKYIELDIDSDPFPKIFG